MPVNGRRSNLRLLLTTKYVVLSSHFNFVSTFGHGLDCEHLASPSVSRLSFVMPPRTEPAVPGDPAPGPSEIPEDYEPADCSLQTTISIGLGKSCESWPSSVASAAPTYPQRISAFDLCAKSEATAFEESAGCVFVFLVVIVGTGPLHL